MAWSCTAGRFTWNYIIDETLHVISGEAFVTDEKGEVRRLGPGDMVYFPAGSRSNWYIPPTRSGRSPFAGTPCRGRSASCCAPGTSSSIS